jgi:hypothetical protein
LFAKDCARKQSAWSLDTNLVMNWLKMSQFVPGKLDKVDWGVPLLTKKSVGSLPGRLCSSFFALVLDSLSVTGI